MAKALSLNDLYSRLEAISSIEVQWHSLHYTAGDFLFPKIVTRSARPTTRILMIGAGVHADEVSGPLTIAKYGQDIVDRAHAHNLGLILYPMRNPSAFGIPSKRYNVDSIDDAVPIGNNDFLRYELADSSVVDDLKDGSEFVHWGWASDPRYHVSLPPETRLMHDLLRQDPLYNVAGVIDLHQDLYTSADQPLAYHYAFGDLSAYQPIVNNIARIVPVARNRVIGAGYGTLIAKGQWTRNAPSASMPSDENGFIVRHDGTWTDLMCRIGESQGRRIHCVTAETTGATPLETACQVNLLWIYGIIDLLSRVG